MTLYQVVCFPIYGIARVNRRRYFAFDRHKLADPTTGSQKVHCTYCSYANGLIACMYVKWPPAPEHNRCPIKHALNLTVPHGRYDLFFDYGDAERYRRDLAPLRDALRRPAISKGSEPCIAPPIAGWARYLRGDFGPDIAHGGCRAAPHLALALSGPLASGGRALELLPAMTRRGESTTLHRDP